MTRIKQTITTKTKRIRVRKDGKSNSAGLAICKNCGGDGVVRVRKK